MSLLAAPDHSDPRVYDRDGARMFDADRMQPGLALISSTWNQDRLGNESWKPGLELIDGEGRVWHEWRIDSKAPFRDPAKRRAIGLS